MRQREKTSGGLDMPQGTRYLTVPARKTLHLIEYNTVERLRSDSAHVVCQSMIRYNFIYHPVVIAVAAAYM